MFEVVLSEEINVREDFPLLCNARGVRVPIEVGTDIGKFACSFLEKFQGEEMYCIDNYKPYEYMKGQRTADMIMAIVALQKYYPRVKIVQDKSPEVCKRIVQHAKWIANRIDFVYIDAGHSYIDVKKDIEAWWHILSDHGILAGHDYDDNTHKGVVKAVNEFAEYHDLKVRLTKEPYCQSWYIYKTEPESPMVVVDQIAE